MLTLVLETFIDQIFKKVDKLYFREHFRQVKVYLLNPLAYGLAYGQYMLRWKKMVEILFSQN